MSRPTCPPRPRSAAVVSELRRRGAFAIVLVVLVGCAPETRLTARAASGAEASLLGAALTPLLDELGYERPRAAGDCRVGVAVLPSPVINASTGPGSTTPCTWFRLIVTEGTLARLPVAMLRAILAHELGHVQLRHGEARHERGAGAGLFRPFTRAFDREEEAAADRFAVELLRRLEPRYPGACVALVYVFALLAEQPGGPARWLATHPSPDRRAEVALAGCNRRE
jgi:Zn-dependent protease with chaperone function